jgi:hypothetical protein
LNINNAIDQFHDSKRKRIEWILVILSGVLLGIWAVKDTIALRNILLVCGALLSSYYIFQELKYGHLKEQCTTWKVLPIIMLGLIFIWIVIHYLFFSVNPVQQLEELKSTWFRAFLASIIGLGTGLAIRSYPRRLNLLWLGIFVVFLFLFYQYIPQALSQKKLLIPSYGLFNLKFNAVLMGTLMLAGINGATIDYVRVSYAQSSKLLYWYVLYWLLGTISTAWAFVYIFDTRNGVGLSVLLNGFLFICGLIFFISAKPRGLRVKAWIAPLFFSFVLLFFLYFAFLQTTVNRGWDNFIEDVQIAIQIDRHPHWQNVPQFGYPVRDDGLVVLANTYERFAWAAAGLRAIPRYPQGVGVLDRPFEISPNSMPQMPDDSYYVPKIVTHSGWIELGLAFGVPILSLIFISLCSTFIEAIRNTHLAKMTVLALIFTISSLYLVGEVAIQHGIEILIFLMALLPALLLKKQCQKHK